jgi:hypothetical protein
LGDALRGALGGVDVLVVRLLGGVLGDGEVFDFSDGVLGSDLNSKPEIEDHPDDEDDEEVFGVFGGVSGSEIDSESNDEGHPDDEDDEADEDDEEEEEEEEEEEDDDDEEDDEDEEDDDELSGAGRFGAPLRGAFGGVDMLIVRLLGGVLGAGEVFCFFDGVLGTSSSPSSSSSSSSLKETFFLSQRLRLLPLDKESRERSTVGVLPFNSSVRKSAIAVS